MAKKELARVNETGAEKMEIIDAEIVDEPVDGRTARLAELEARRAASMEAGQIDNGSLYAGSPMHYYCKFCGVKTETLPETWFISLPKKICSDCETLIELGWHDGKTPSFPLRGSRIQNLSN